MSEQKAKLPYPYVVRLWVKNNKLEHILIEGPFDSMMQALNYGRNLATKAGKNEEVYNYTSFSRSKDEIINELSQGSDSQAAKLLVRLN